MIIPVAALSGSAEHDHDHSEDTENSLYQETGYFIVTDTDTFLIGDNLGMIRVKSSETHMSTGDYGSVIFMGEPYDENGTTVTSLGATVTEDGTVNYSAIE